MTILTIDFETRSALDLPEVGLDNYACHPSTDVWCMGWAFDNETVDVVGHDELGTFGDFSAALEYVEQGATVVAHNAAFELAIWNSIMVPRYGWPPLKPEQVIDTMAMCYAMGLPGSLENAAAAVGLEVQKDMAGRRLMLQMARPKPDGYAGMPEGQYAWHDDADKLQRLYDYCKTDVEVERQLYSRLQKLSQSEQALWVLDYQINQRGVYVDLPAIKAAIKIVEAETARLNEAMRRVTNGAVASCTAVAQLGDWLRNEGAPIGSLSKASVIDALSLDGIPDHCKQALKLRQEAGKSSTAKLKKMLALAGPDGRLRNQLQYHAAATGRWGGRGAQLQNFPRGSMKPDEVDDAIELMGGDSRLAAGALDMYYGPPLDVISSCLRGMITAAPGHELIACDYSNIEGRVLAWLAGEDWKLEAFRAFDRGDGPDLYLVAASRIYGCEPKDAKPHRQIGKVSELALGYQGGVGAFQSMAKIYGVKVPDDQADGIKTKWREAHPRTVKFWYALEEAAIAAVLNPGGIFSAGHKGRPCKFRKVGSFIWCQLPSKRVLCYPYPRIVEGKFGRDAIQYMAVDGMTKKWDYTDTYGGSLAENVTQAVARDVLANALTTLEQDGYDVVFHVHDECVAEIPIDDSPDDELVQMMADAMCRLPAWAKDLPVVATGWRGTRYRKD